MPFANPVLLFKMLILSIAGGTVNGGAKAGQRGGVKAGHLRRALTI